MSQAASAARRGTWPLVVAALAAAGAAGTVAVLAGAPGTASGRGFGPALGEALGTASSSSAPAGAVVAPAPVIAAAVPDGPLAVAPAPAASVGSGHDLASAAFRPTRLVLPGGRSARIDAVGLHHDGSLVIPDDPRVVGWWEGSSRPGEPFGSVVVAGHVDSARRGIGVLAELPTLHAGQVVELTSGRRNVRYSIVSAGLVPQARLSVTGLFRRTGSAQLVLITCGGPFDPVHHRYADNYVVLAEPTS